jgi:hypothetical protein
MRTLLAVLSLLLVAACLRITVTSGGRDAGSKEITDIDQGVRTVPEKDKEKP